MTPKVKKVVSIGLLASLSGKWYVPAITSAAKVAVDKINNDATLLQHIDLQLEIHDVACDKEKGIEAALMLFSQNTNVLVGPGCGIVCEQVGSLSKFQKIPQVSRVAPSHARSVLLILGCGTDGCGTPALSDKNDFPFFVRTSSVITKKYGPPVAAFVQVSTCA